MNKRNAYQIMFKNIELYVIFTVNLIQNLH